MSDLTPEQVQQVNLLIEEKLKKIKIKLDYKTYSPDLLGVFILLDNKPISQSWVYINNSLGD
jgi:hypothetical protein